MKKNLLILCVFFFAIILSSQAQELWGVTSQGGLAYGAIFKTDINGENYSLEHQIPGYLGGSPEYTKLCEASNGKLYGLTSSNGTLFEYDPSLNSYSTICYFSNSTNGISPRGSLIEASNGKLYGMTTSGGSNNKGVIFEYDLSTKTYSKEFDFDGSANGEYPFGSLTEASNGKLYGMTSQGGENDFGVLFEFDPSNSSFNKILDFSGPSNGMSPYGSLILASNNKLYGMTLYGGTNGRGIIFEYNPSSNVFAKVHDFQTDGSNPFGDLYEASNGNLYGLTYYGGNADHGVIFKFDPSSNTYSMLYSFSSNGRRPRGSLIETSSGVLYGMTSEGGTTGYGEIFEYRLSTNTYTTKLIFDGTNKGRKPFGTLIQTSDSLLYGMTSEGGSKGQGVFFEFNPSDDSFSKILDFGTNHGYQPLSNFIQAPNGKLYGLTNRGGEYDDGVLYEFNPISGNYIKIIDFIGGSTGEYPQGSLILAENGKLYGMTKLGGTNSWGTIFEFNFTNNTLTKKIDFNDLSNGMFPYESLLNASNGKLYGMANNGGVNFEGTLFEYDPSNNSFTKLIDFDNASKGRYPQGSLIQASNGKLYGMTTNGGSQDYGVIFEYDINTNTFTKKVDFLVSARGGTPTGSLVEASNGKLYGLTRDGGSNAKGVLFEYDPSTNTFTKKIDFDGTSKGKSPYGTLFESSNGKLYGMTNSGGVNDLGVLFEYDPSTNTFTKKLDFDGTNGSHPLYAQLIEVNTDQYTWNGSADSDWDNTANWSDSKAPIGTNSVIIPSGITNYPTITTTAYVNDLTMQSNTSLKGQNYLYKNGTITIERQITGYSSSSDGWHFLSSPVSNQTISGSDFVPSSGDDLYEWGESSGEWLNYNGGSFGDSEFEVGKGYLVAYDNTATKEFTGHFNTGTVTKNLTYTAGMGDGWNLLGNPYPSAIDWDLITRSGDVDDAAYIVNPTDGTYKSWVEGVGDITDGEIPVNQGFFVKANSGGQSVTMELADQVHSSNNFNKSTNALPENTLKISLNAANSENNTYVRFKYDATEHFDSHSDAYKLFGFAVIPQVYTHLEETDYSINALNFSTEAISIPLGIYLNAEEDLSFQFTGLEGFDGNTRIELEDKTANKIIHLREQSSYYFRGVTSDEAERFVLHFSQVTGLEDIAAQDAQVYAFDGRVYIRLEEGANYSQMHIFDLSGRLLIEQALSKQSLQSFDINELKGVYLVQLQGEDGSFTEKVTL